MNESFEKIWSKIEKLQNTEEYKEVVYDDRLTAFQKRDLQTLQEYAYSCDAFMTVAYDKCVIRIIIKGTILMICDFDTKVREIMNRAYVMIVFKPDNKGNVLLELIISYSEWK